MSNLEIDDEFDVPICYLKLFGKPNTENKSKAHKELIEITVQNIRGKRIVTTIKNLKHYITDLKSFQKKIKTKLGTSCSIEIDPIKIQGDFAETIREILISYDNISESDFKEINNASNSSNIIEIHISKNNSDIRVKNLPINILKWFSNKKRVLDTFHSRCDFRKENQKTIIRLLDEPDLQRLIQFLKDRDISDNEFVVYEDFVNVTNEIHLPYEPNNSIFNTHNYLPLPKKCPLDDDIYQLKTTNEHLRFYFENNLALIRAELEDAKREKAELSIREIKLVFDKVKTINNNNIWRTKFPIDNDLIQRGDSQSTSNRFICIGDKVVIDWYDNYDDCYKGEVKKIVNGDIIVEFELENGKNPINSWNKKSNDKSEEKTVEIKYDIMFEPNETIYRRRALALLYLVDFMENNPIRDLIIFENTEISNNHFSNVSNDIRTSINTSFSEFLKKDSSKHIPEATYAQELAVKKSLENHITLIQGPPGCGKTITATAIVIEMLRNVEATKNKKILICCQSNVAVENVIKVLAPQVKAIGKKLTWVTANSYDFTNQYDFLNASEEEKNLLFYQCLTRETRESRKYYKIKEKYWTNNQPIQANDFKDLNNLVKIIGRNIIFESDVVCCTLESSMKSFLDDFTFDTVLIDEATQAIEVASILPIIHHPQKLILVGDQKQLSPVLTGRARSEKLKFKSSLFVRLLVEENFDYILLNHQFRMHPKISQLSNKLFYEMKLIDNVDETERNYPEIKNINLPITYYHCEGNCKEQNKSYRNQDEATLIEDIVQFLIKFGNINPKDIGIIAFYSAQVIELKLKFEKQELYYGIKIATVDSFQGSERDIIILSTVLNDPDIIENSFILDERRINVAITRARYGLIIVGNEKALCKASPGLWGKIFEHINTVSTQSDESLLKFQNISVQRRSEYSHNSLSFNKNNKVEPFKEKFKDYSSGFQRKEVESSITKGKFNIYWPDDDQNVYDLDQYVKIMVEKMNKGKTITLAYDAESVCIQFGQIFNDDFDPYDIQSDDDIPSIGNSNGVIAFFYSKTNNKKDKRLMEIVRPLFEHENLILLTFDLTFDLEILHEFKIYPKYEGIIDCQFINYKEEITDEEDLIIERHVSSLKSLLKVLQYKGKYSDEVKAEINENKGKDFPFNENNFVMKVTQVPKISVVTNKFLQYAANDIPFTGMIFAEVLYQDKLEKVIELTRKRLQDFDNAEKNVKKPKYLRQVSFLEKENTTILYKTKFADNTQIDELISKWNDITNVLRILSKNNEILKSFIPFTNEEIQKIKEILENIEELLKTPDNWKKLCSNAQLSIPNNVNPIEPDINKSKTSKEQKQ